MSRHIVENDGRREVAVGWDPPLGTFYAQIFTQPGKLYEECVWWIGYQPHEVKTVETLVDALGEQGVVLSATSADKLRADQAEPWEPGPLQKMFGYDDTA